MQGFYGRVVWIAVLALTGMTACQEDGTYSLSISFPDDAARESVSQISIQALETSGRTCQDLLDGTVDPGMLLERSGLSIDYPPQDESVLGRVPTGTYLFWARGLEGSAVLLRGCAAGRVKDGAHMQVDIALEWTCRPHPEGEQPLNGTDDDCDGLTDECLADSECDNGNFCTIDLCISGFCSHNATSREGDACDDGDPCTLTSACVSGVCTGSADDCGHLDSACLVGVCDPALPVTDHCVAVPRADGTSCEDGLFCTIDDACLAGKCVDSTERDCDDGDPCTLDVCLELEERCEHIPQPNPGAEGPTGDATCSNGLDDDCDGRSDLDDPNCFDCAEDIDCEDSNPCTIDRCLDSVCINQAVDDGLSCDDGRACTIHDRCQAGICVSDAVDCSHLSDGCNLGLCEQETGLCQARPLDDGTSCEDGAFCTVGDSCQSGSCQSGQERSCADDDPCTVDSCDEDADLCRNIVQLNPGAEGPPGDATCMDGIDNDCDGLTDLDDLVSCFECSSDSDCDEGNPCIVFECLNSACVTTSLPEGTDCESDGLYCTHERCSVAGVCQSASRDCSEWSSDCYVGTCSESLGICYPEPQPEGHPCGETYCEGLNFMQPTCDADRQCAVASIISVCDDGDRCTEDACSPMQGCQVFPIAGCAVVLVNEIDDYAVAGDGSIFVARTLGSDRLMGQCYLANGTPRANEFAIFEGPIVEPSAVQVVTAHEAGSSLVTVVARDNAGDPNSRYFLSALFDANCVQTKVFPWPAPSSGNLYFDTAMADDGRFAILWQDGDNAYLGFFGSDGVQEPSSPRLVNNAGQCNSGRGFHVALHPGGGGIVTCQGNLLEAIRYRRFDAGGNFLDGSDSGMSELSQTGSGITAAWSHQVGINANGIIAVEWQDGIAHAYDVLLLNADGSFRQELRLRDALFMQSGAFMALHQKVALLGDDFIFRDHESPFVLYQVDQDGQVLGCDSFEYLKTSLRSSGGVLHMLDGERIVRNVEDFSAWLGCSPGRTGPKELSGHEVVGDSEPSEQEAVQ